MSEAKANIERNTEVEADIDLGRSLPFEVCPQDERGEALV